MLPGRKQRPRRKDYWTGPLVVILLIVALGVIVVIVTTTKGTH